MSQSNLTCGSRRVALTFPARDLLRLEDAALQAGLKPATYAKMLVVQGLNRAEASGEAGESRGSDPVSA